MHYGAFVTGRTTLPPLDVKDGIAQVLRREVRVALRAALILMPQDLPHLVERSPVLDQRRCQGVAAIVNPESSLDADKLCTLPRATHAEERERAALARDEDVGLCRIPIELGEAGMQVRRHRDEHRLARLRLFDEDRSCIEVDAIPQGAEILAAIEKARAAMPPQSVWIHDVDAVHGGRA